MLYRFVYKILSHFNERRVKPSRSDYNLVRNLVTVPTGYSEKPYKT